MKHACDLSVRRSEDGDVGQFERGEVVVAGMMGSEIAFVFTLAGRPANISDQTKTPAASRPGISRGVARRKA